MSSSERDMSENSAQMEAVEEHESQNSSSVSEAPSAVEPNLPQKLAEVSEIAVVLPGHGPDKQRVHLRLSDIAVPFEQQYEAKLKKNMKKGALDLSANGTTLVWKPPARENEDANSNADEEGESPTVSNGNLDPAAQSTAVLHWAPYAFSNDVFYLNRVLSTMFGWVSPPPRDVKSAEAVLSGERKNDGIHRTSQADHDGADAEDSAHRNASRFNKSGAFADAESAKEESARDLDSAEIRHSKHDRHVSISISQKDMASVTESGGESCSHRRAFQRHSSLRQLPPPAVPRFLDSQHLFYFAYEKKQQRWELLDAHPDLLELRARPKRVGERDGVDVFERGTDEEDDAPSDAASSDAKGGENRGDNTKVEPEDARATEYDRSSMILANTLVIAVLCCPTLLRYCLLQRRAPSLTYVQQWVEADPPVGFPLLSTVYRTLLAIRATDAPRLPYCVPHLEFDFNFFFGNMFVYSTTSLRLRGEPPRRAGVFHASDYFAAVPSRRSRIAVTCMSDLLQVGVIPDRPLTLSNFRDTESARLALWLLLILPQAVLLQWGSHGHTASASPAAAADEDRGDADPENSSVGGETTAGLLERAVVMRAKAEHSRMEAERRRSQGPLLRVAPLLQQVLLEIRRRVARERDGLPPSKYALKHCVEAVLRRTTVEDGEAHGDPLITANYLESGAEPSAPCSRPRNAQRLYQSDLALLALVLTSTQRNLRPPLSHHASASISATEASISIGAVSVRRSTLSKGQLALPDAHYDLFRELLHAKVARHTTPLEKSCSGTFRLLFSVLPSFQRSLAASCLCDAAPLYELLGEDDSCPLTSLVLAWASEGSPTTPNHLNVFVDTFWYEIYLRLSGHLYPQRVVEVMQKCLPDLIDKVMQRHEMYQHLLVLLGGRLHVHSAVHRVDYVCKGHGKMAHEESRVGAGALITCSEELEAEEQRVTAAFEALSMAPRTYFSPETLYALLFKVQKVDAIAVRFVVLKKKITTVRANPFTDFEVPALDYALRVQNATAASFLVRLGASLDEPMQGGAMSRETYAVKHLSASAVTHLRRLWLMTEQLAVSDPNKRFGEVRVL